MKKLLLIFVETLIPLGLLLSCFKVSAAERVFEKSRRLDSIGSVPVVVLAGTPEEIGRAHGVLLRREIRGMANLLKSLAVPVKQERQINLFEQLKIIREQQQCYIPRRFIAEMTALGESSGIGDLAFDLVHFTDLFHCSGIAAAKKATTQQTVVHLRVLDYAGGIGLQKFAAIQIFLPDKFHAWVSIGFAGLTGSVTATNEKGLSIGEIGGYSCNDYQGIPMCFLIRRIMEECSDVPEAIKLFNSVRSTCEFYYVLSDTSGNLAMVHTKAGEKPAVVRANETSPWLQGGKTFENLVWYTNKVPNRKKLCEAVEEHYGALDENSLQKITKKIRLEDNLQNVIFLPRTRKLLFSYAGDRTPACDEKYQQLDYGKILQNFKKTLAADKAGK